MIEFHRHFERFAAKTSESATGQNAVNGIRFSEPFYMFLFQFILNTLHFQIKIYKIFSSKFTAAIASSV